MKNLHRELAAFSEAIKEVISSSAVEELAKEIGFVERERNFTGFHLLSLCAFHAHVGRSSLSKMCASLSTHFQVSISGQGLNQRFNTKAVQLMKEIFRSLLSLERSFPSLPVMDLFQRIRILDSTSFGVSPNQYQAFKGYHGSGVKIQLEYDLKSGEFLQFVLQEQKEPDQSFAYQIQDTVEPGDLCIRDLGYFSTQDLKAISNRKGFFLSRLHDQTGVYIETEKGDFERLDITKYEEELAEGEYLELSVYVGKREMIPSRLVLYRLNEDEHKRRMDSFDKKEKKRGVKYTPQTKKHKVLNKVITNIPENMVKATDLFTLYSLRWQIELVFKGWKSIFEIDHVKAMKQERFECFLYGRFIALLLSENLLFRIRYYLFVKKQKQLSEFKGLDIIETFLPEISCALKKGGHSLMSLFQKVRKTLEKNGIKSKRCGKSRSIEILDQLSQS